MIVEPSKGGYEGVEIPDGLYVLTCKKVEETILANDQYGKTDKFRLTLASVTEDGEHFEVQPLLNQAWSEKANLFIYAQAFGLDPDPDLAFDTDEFVGKKAQGLVVTGEEKGAWPRVQTISRIKGIKANGEKPAKANGSVASEDDLDNFWKRVKAGGFDRKEVAPYVDGDLAKMVEQTPDQLAKILVDMGV